MQGKKIYQEKLFTDFTLSDRVPKNNFYRRLKAVLDLDYLYKDTRIFHGTCGQKSLDPVVEYLVLLGRFLIAHNFNIFELWQNEYTVKNLRQ